MLQRKLVRQVRCSFNFKVFDSDFSSLFSLLVTTLALMNVEEHLDYRVTKAMDQKLYW